MNDQPLYITIMVDDTFITCQKNDPWHWVKLNHIPINYNSSIDVYVNYHLYEIKINRNEFYELYSFLDVTLYSLVQENKDIVIFCDIIEQYQQLYLKSVKIIKAK